MTLVTTKKVCSEASLSEHLVWRAKCGFMSRTNLQKRDSKRLRQDLNTNDAPCLVEAGLYLGSHDSEKDKEALLGLGITHILQVGAELKPSHPEDFEYKSLELYDLPQEDVVSQFPVCFEFVQAALDQGKKVLVHCAAGVSRSACVAVGYLMCKKQLSLREAKDVVESARPIVQLNIGFYLQLKLLERLECNVEEWPGWNTKRLSENQSCSGGLRRSIGPLRTMSAPVLSVSSCVST